jgi:ABC-type polysaccharide/polyol phosphate export permease
MVKDIVEEASEIVSYRELLKNLIVRDIKVRYRRSVLGFVWVMLNPLLMMLILTIVFSAVFKIATENYTIYLLSGIITWNFFSQSTNATVTSFLSNRNLIKKIYLPKAIFPLSLILSALINFVFSLVPLGLVMIFTHVPIGTNIILLPVVLLLLVIFSFGVSLFLSTATVFFHDIAYIYEVILLGWMYATPVFYPDSIIPEKFSIILKLNPLYHFMKLFRGWLYLDAPLYSQSVLFGAGFAILALAAGSAFYVMYKDRVVYYL